MEDGDMIPRFLTAIGWSALARCNSHEELLPTFSRYGYIYRATSIMSTSFDQGSSVHVRMLVSEEPNWDWQETRTPWPVIIRVFWSLPTQLKSSTQFSFMHWERRGYLARHGNGNSLRTVAVIRSRSTRSTRKCVNQPLNADHSEKQCQPVSLTAASASRVAPEQPIKPVVLKWASAKPWFTNRARQ